MLKFIKTRAGENFPSRLRGWVSRLRPSTQSLGRRQRLLLTARQFDREINRERIRATRRSIPFCLVNLELVVDRRASAVVRKGMCRLIDVLCENLRRTDEKGQLSRCKICVLLVDTPEMGGRTVVDRLGALLMDAGLNVRIDLQIHDPNGFDGSGFEGGDGTGHADEAISVTRRRDDREEKAWDRKPLPVPSATVELVEPHGVSFSSHELSSPMPGLAMLFKRAMDVVGALIGLTIVSPFLLVAMALIKWHDRGPVFFAQTREGKGGRAFTIYKLRTMIVDAEKLQAGLRAQSHRDGPAFKIRRDPRVTPIGHFLRATCLDELPQLLNVLKGDMSLVGPRPLPWHESRACNLWHRRRLDVRPGLTCIWQINKAKAETFDDWMRMDLRYIDRLSILLDMQLIARTALVPVFGRGGD